MEDLTGPEKTALAVAINHFKKSLDNETLDMGTNGLIANDAWKLWVEAAEKKLQLPKL